MQLVVRFLLPLDSLIKYPASKPDKDLQKKLTTLRDSYDGQADGTIPPIVKAWCKSLGGCDIMQYKFAVPRKHDILKEWGIVTERDKAKVAPIDDSSSLPDTVEILLQFPSTLLQDKENIGATRNKNGTIPIQDLDVTKFFQHNSTIPVIVFFHGGGLTIGSTKGSDGIDFLSRPSKQVEKPLILASVEYRLSPDFPFPTAVEDSLVAFSFVKDIMKSAHKSQTEKIPLHICGSSAGGNLASVLTMESQRLFPGLVKSSLILCPMLDPRTGSTSYFLNSKSSRMASVEWLRWCWKSYLGLPDSNETASVLDSEMTFEDRKKVGSNHDSWVASKWRATPYERLVNPVLNMPEKGWDDETVVPNILVVTHEADPLRDDGLALVEALQNKGMTSPKLQHIHTNGSHFLGLLFEKQSVARVESWLVESIFPVSYQK